MPTHDFKCNKCLYVWEEFWHITEHDSNMEKLAKKEWKCPECSSDDVMKFVNAPSIVFKGVPGQSGFYDLDYPNKKAISDTVAKPKPEEEQNKSFKDKMKDMYKEKLDNKENKNKDK